VALGAMPRLQLTGFNNLTKTLCLNSYDVGYASTPAQQKRYLAYIDETYNTERLTKILSTVAGIIGGNILNIARQDYEPQGASVALLISEGSSAAPASGLASEPPGPWPDALLCHLDKSHITIHTYPESQPNQGISVFRADIDVSTCGRISPLKALDYLIDCFKPDIASIDYRVRGFTRDDIGNKHFIDHPIHSIQDFLSQDASVHYQMIDINLAQQQIFYTRMLRKDSDLRHYQFGPAEQDAPFHDQSGIERRVRQEMTEIFYGEN